MPAHSMDWHLVLCRFPPLAQCDRTSVIPIRSKWCFKENVWLCDDYRSVQIYAHIYIKTESKMNEQHFCVTEARHAAQEFVHILNLF